MSGDKHWQNRCSKPTPNWSFAQRNMQHCQRTTKQNVLGKVQVTRNDFWQMTANSKVNTWMAVGRRLVKLTQQPFLHQQLAITYQLQLLQLVNSNPTHGNCVWVLLICIVAHELKPSTTRWHCTSSNFPFMWVSFFLLSELHWFWINKNLYVSTAVFVHIMDRQLRNTLSISCFEISKLNPFVHYMSTS